MWESSWEDGLSLRPVLRADTPALYQVVRENQLHLAEWFPWAIDLSQESQLIAFVEEQISLRTERQALVCLILLDGQPIGITGTHPIDFEHSTAKLGYWISKSYEGQGYASRTTRALIQHLFEDWDLHRIEIQCAETNSRSSTLANRMGFTEEGRLRDAIQLPSGVTHLIVYGLLKTDPSPET